jgi:hypothetical protein
MTNIVLDKIGKVLKGDDKGCFIKIVKDTERTKGYYIFICKNKSFTDEVFDYWLEKYDDIPQFFIESKWEIEWEK